MTKTVKVPLVPAHKLTSAAHRVGIVNGALLAFTFVMAVLWALVGDWPLFFLQAFVMGPALIYFDYKSLQEWGEIEKMQDEFLVRAAVLHQALDVGNNPIYRKMIDDYIKAAAEAALQKEMTRD